MLAVASDHEGSQHSDSLSGVTSPPCSSLSAASHHTVMSVPASATVSSVPDAIASDSSSSAPPTHMFPASAAAAIPQDITAAPQPAAEKVSATIIQAPVPNLASALPVSSFPVTEPVLAPASNMASKGGPGAIVHSMPESQQPLSDSSAHSALSVSMLNQGDQVPQQQQQQLTQAPVTTIQKSEMLQQGLPLQQLTETQPVQPAVVSIDQSQIQQNQILLQQQQSQTVHQLNQVQLQPTHPEPHTLLQPIELVPQPLAQTNVPTGIEQNTQFMAFQAQHPGPHLLPAQHLVSQQIPQQQGQGPLLQPLGQQAVHIQPHIQQQQASLEQMQPQAVVQQQYVQQESFQDPLQHRAQVQSVKPQQVPAEQMQPQPMVHQVPQETLPSQPAAPPVQKQPSLQQSESELSTGEASITDDSHSTPLQISSDVTLPPLPLMETTVPPVAHMLTPSPAQPSSVAESDSEGPPKIEFVDNRIKTLDEKLRTLLYQEYSGSGTPSAGSVSAHTAASASAASVSAGGDESSESHSLPPSAFPPPPASSSDTSPHSSSCTTSSTTPRSSSTSPDEEKERMGEEDVTQSAPAPSTAVECQPASSTSPPCSLLAPSQEPAPGLPPGEPSVLVSWVYKTVPKLFFISIDVEYL